MWSYKKNGVAWAKMTLPIEQGGVGLLDPKTVFETQLIRIIKLMHTQADQPWVKWLTRDETKLKRLWSCEGNLYSFTPSKTQMWQLRRSAVQNLGLFENMVVAWHEADGTTSGGYQAKHLGRSETDLRREVVQEALRKDGGAQVFPQGQSAFRIEAGEGEFDQRPLASLALHGLLGLRQRGGLAVAIAISIAVRQGIGWSRIGLGLIELAGRRCARKAVVGGERPGTPQRGVGDPRHNRRRPRP